MISPSTLTDFAWSTATLGNPGSDAVAASAATDQAQTVDSFQSILAQTITPTSPASQSSSQATSVASFWSTAPSSTAQADSSASTTSFSAAGSQSNDPSSTASSNSERGTSKSTAKPATSRGTTAKVEHIVHIPLLGSAQSSRGTSAAVNSNQQPAANTPVSQSAFTTQTDAPTPKNATPNGATTLHALPVTATAALGGAKNLSSAAFAMHITPGTNQADGSKNSAAPTSNAATDTPTPDNNSNSVDALSAAAGTSATPTAQAQTLIETAANTNTAAASFSAVSLTPTPTPAGSSGDSASTSSVIATTESSEIPDEDGAATLQTVRTVQVQLSGEGDNRVDLRLVEHGGGLSVSVRASDSTLTKGLQDNLSELTTRLATDKYDTHTFVPSTAEPSNNGSSSSDSSSGGSQPQSNGRSFSQSGSDSGANSGGGQQQQQGQQDQSNSWSWQLAALNQLSGNSSMVAAPSEAANTLGTD